MTLERLLDIMLTQDCTVIGSGRMDQGNSLLTGTDELITLARVPDVSQRGHALVRRMAAMNDSDLIGALNTILDRALMGEADYVALYNSMLDSSLFAWAMGADRIAELVSLARVNDEIGILTILGDVTGKGVRTSRSSRSSILPSRRRPWGSERAWRASPTSKW